MADKIGPDTNSVLCSFIPVTILTPTEVSLYFIMLHTAMHATCITSCILDVHAYNLQMWGVNWHTLGSQNTHTLQISKVLYHWVAMVTVYCGNCVTSISFGSRILQCSSSNVFDAKGAIPNIASAIKQTLQNESNVLWPSDQQWYPRYCIGSHQGVTCCYYFCCTAWNGTCWGHNSHGNGTCNSDTEIWHWLIQLCPHQH